MPTEELFGAYHVLQSDHDHLTDHNWMLEIEGVTTGAGDVFEFTGSVEPQKVGLLLPAVQAVIEEGRTAAADTTGASHFDDWRETQAADSGHDKWIDVLSTDWGTQQPAAAAYGGRLRSDGDLVIAVIDADMGGDFIL